MTPDATNAIDAIDAADGDFTNYRKLLMKIIEENGDEEKMTEGRGQRRPARAPVGR